MQHLKPDLLFPFYREILDLLPSVPTRLSSEAVAAAFDSECPVRKISLPWLWATADDGEISMRVNVTRIGAKLASEGPPAVQAEIGPYTRLLAKMISQDVMAEVDAARAEITATVVSSPLAEVAEPTPDDAAKLHHAAHCTGLTVGQFHSRILMRSLH